MRSLLQRLSEFLLGLLQPQRIERVSPPPPVPPRDAVRGAITRLIVADIISGSDSTVLDMAVFAGAPFVVDAVVARGAEAGAREFATRGHRPRRESIDVTNRRS